MSDGAELGSLNALAKRLNEMGHQTPRGGAWTATAVRRALARVAAEKSATLCFRRLGLIPG